MDGKNILESLLDFIKENKADCYKYIFLAGASPISEVLLPHFYGKVIDTLTHSQGGQVFSNNKSNFIIILALWIISQSMGTMSDRLDMQFIPKLTAYFRNDMIQRILKYYEDKGDEPEIGDLLCKIMRVPNIVRDLFYQFRTYLLPTSMILLAATCYLFWLNRELGFIMIAGLMVFFTTLYKFAKESIIENEETLKKFDELHEDITDVLSNMSNIHTANNFAQEIERLMENQKPFNESYKNGLYRISLFKRIFSAAYFGMFGMVGGYTLKLYSENKITIAETSSVLIVLLFILVNLSDVSNGIRDFIFNISGLVSIQNFVDKIDEKSVNTVQHNFLDNSLKIQNLSIANDKGDLLVKNLNFDIIPGGITILRGPVGSGKSSVLKAILKNRKIVEGDILIGGVSIKNLSPKDIRKQVAYISQNPTLFNRSILDNILYGNSDIGEPEVTKLIAQYNIQEISTNNNNLRRLAGKNGSNLSGGQRQIVMILRFILRKTPIILLDEPTSSLSPSLKASVLKLIKSLNDGQRTILITTHDEDVQKIADRTVIIR
jgi:ATP-binding cassette subfamily B protein